VSNLYQRLTSSLTGWRKALLTILAGAVVTLTLPPFDFLPAGFIGFPLLILLIDRDVQTGVPSGWKRLRPAFITGWLFGFGYFLAGLWWIGMALLVDAENFAWALPLAILGLPAFLALFFACATAMARIFWGAGLIRILVLAIMLGLSEYIRSFILTGFPWNALGYALMPTPLLMQSVTITGLYGMNILAVVIFAMPALMFGSAWQRFGWRSGLTIAIVLLVAHAGYGAWRLQQVVSEPAADAPIIRLVQASIPQDAKWDNQLRREIFDKHLNLSTRTPLSGKPLPDVIIWPETSVPYVLPQVGEALSAIGAALQPNQILLAGAVRGEGEALSSYYNSIFAINSAGQVTTVADKVHLVPFGEYLPLEGLLRSLGMQEVIELPGGFTAAPARHSMNISPKLTLLPLICYEAIFPSELGYQGKAVDAIINITNDAWYGNTPGPYQHFRQAQLRAVEQGLPLLRAANNGISAITDSYGRISAQMKLNEIGIIDAPLPPKAATFWGKPAGDTQFFFILLFTLIISCGLQGIRTQRFG
jgi:apolipoprotein N-acyltransferase